MHSLTTLFPLISISAGLALAAHPLGAAVHQETAAGLRFAPTAETELSTEFKLSESTNGAELSVWMNGAQVPSSFLPQLQFEYALEIERVFTDRSAVLVDGALQSFVREFSAAERSGTGSWDYGQGPGAEDARAVSRFQGETLRYELGDDDGFLGTNADEDGPQAPDLEAFDAPGFGWLLEGAKAEAGAEWELPADLLVRLRSIGGRIADPLELEGAEWMDEPEDDQTWEGELSATFERADGNLARIAIGGQTVSTGTRATDLEQVPVADGTATETASTTHVLEGLLVWDLKRGLPVELTLTDMSDTTLETTRDEGQPGADYRSELLFEGNLEIAVQFTAEAR